MKRIVADSYFTIFKCLVMASTMYLAIHQLRPVCTIILFSFTMWLICVCATFVWNEKKHKKNKFLFHSSHIVTCFACDALINYKSDLLSECIQQRMSLTIFRVKERVRRYKKTTSFTINRHSYTTHWYIYINTIVAMNFKQITFFLHKIIHLRYQQHYTKKKKNYVRTE